MRVLAPMVVLLMCATSASAQRAELIERTVAIVGGQAITLSDVRAALALGLFEVGDGADPIVAGSRRMIERVLVLREVQRYAPAEPSDTAIDARVRAVAARFPSPDAYRAAVVAAGFSEALVRAWARDDLRIDAYIDQRFTAAGVAVDADVASFYAQHRDEYERAGASFEQAAPAIRERLAIARRGELVTDWISDLRRRTRVVELLK
jgi:hypothetical protein